MRIDEIVMKLEGVGATLGDLNEQIISQLTPEQVNQFPNSTIQRLIEAGLLLDIEGACQYYGCERQNIYEAMKRKPPLLSFKSGNSRYFTRAWLEQYRQDSKEVKRGRPRKQL